MVEKDFVEFCTTLIRISFCGMFDLLGGLWRCPRHTNGGVCPLHWLGNWFSHKCLCIFICDMFDKKIKLYVFFKASPKSNYKIEVLKHKIHDTTCAQNI